MEYCIINEDMEYCVFFSDYYLECLEHLELLEALNDNVNYSIWEI